MYREATFPVINLEKTGRCIEWQRRQAGLSVRDLQNYFGFEYPQAIYKWQHGECLPTVDNLLALARLLQVPMEDLLVYDEDQEVSFFLYWFLITGLIDSLFFLNQQFNDLVKKFCYYMTIIRKQNSFP